MIDERTGRELKNIPELTDGRIYIYIMENELHKIKIGVTVNIQQRYHALCGSNGQGIKIDRLCCSPATYLTTLEGIMHEKFKKYRIPNTEWFYDENGELKFDDVVDQLHKLFSSAEYQKCNKVRESVVKQNLIKTFKEVIE